MEVLWQTIYNIYVHEVFIKNEIKQRQGSLFKKNILILIWLKDVSLSHERSYQVIQFVLNFVKFIYGFKLRNTVYLPFWMSLIELLSLNLVKYNVRDSENFCKLHLTITEWNENNHTPCSNVCRDVV